MPRAPSPRRYAQAAFEIALEHNEPEGWLEDLEVLQQALGQEDIAVFLEAPQVRLTDKLEALQEVMDSVRPLVRNLLSLLVSRGTSRLIPDILIHYRRLLDAHRGIERGEVVTAVALSDNLHQRVADFLKGLVGREVIFSSRVEPLILGGLIARVGDRVIDGSTRTRLEDMRRSIINAAS